MTVNKRKKSTRYRGSQTHGGGAKKKRRGAGHRGGRGMGGSGKRGDSKKPSIWKDLDYFGKKGFSSKSRTPKTVAINVSQLEEMIPRLVSSKQAAKKGDIISVDLGTLGYNKLLGSGNVSMKLAITVAKASPQAVEKVEEVGGSVTVSDSRAYSSPSEKTE